MGRLGHLGLIPSQHHCASSCLGSPDPYPLPFPATAVCQPAYPAPRSTFRTAPHPHQLPGINVALNAGRPRFQIPVHLLKNLTQENFYLSIILGSILPGAHHPACPFFFLNRQCSTRPVSKKYIAPPHSHASIGNALPYSSVIFHPGASIPVMPILKSVRASNMCT